MGSKSSFYPPFAAREEFEALSDREWDEKLRALLSFDTEEAALLHAERIARLKPGDRAKIPDPGARGFTTAVYMGHAMPSGDLLFMFRGEGKRLRAAWVGIYLIRFD